MSDLCNSLSMYFFGVLMAQLLTPNFSMWFYIVTFTVLGILYCISEIRKEVKKDK